MEIVLALLFLLALCVTFVAGYLSGEQHLLRNPQVALHDHDGVMVWVHASNVTHLLRKGFVRDWTPPPTE